MPARRIYDSGPMTGLPGLNFPAFDAAAKQLRAAGYDVVNPAELNPDPAKPYGDLVEMWVCSDHRFAAWRPAPVASLTLTTAPRFTPPASALAGLSTPAAARHPNADDTHRPQVPTASQHPESTAR